MANDSLQPKMKASLRRLCPLFVSKQNIYIYQTICLLTSLALIYCMYFSGCKETAIDLSNHYNKRNVILQNPKPLQCYLFFSILSGPKSILQRKAMRETWLAPRYYNQKIAWKFIIGTKNLTYAAQQELQMEQVENSDLLFLTDFVDSYEGLSAKLLRSMVWVNQNVDSKFVMKLDDDSFVRVDVLLKDLVKRQHLGRLYWGFFRGNANVKRVGPWAERDWYLSDNYLPYALGGGYILSSDLVGYISSVSDLLQLYKSEDVSVGAWLAPVKLNRIHDIRFDTEYKSRGCHNDDIVSHKQKADDMYMKHDQLVHHNKLCREEEEVMLTFDYDWKVPPSKCCKRVQRSTIAKTQNEQITGF